MQVYLSYQTENDQPEIFKIFLFFNTLNRVILGPGRFVGETWGDTDSVSSDSSDSMLDDSLNTSDSDSENEDLQGNKNRKFYRKIILKLTLMDAGDPR